jgi:hypothetical protein
MVHPAVGHLRPLRRVTREQISACLAGTIADDLRIARRRSAQRYRRASASRQKLPLAGAEIQLPLYPRKQTQLGNRAMSEKCQIRKSASGGPPL